MKLSVYTVGQVNSYIKNMFMEDFALRHISIKGEVSNCKYHSSGHIYFSLKDKDGVIACVMFKGNRKGLEFKMQEGQMVVATGTVGVYERDGRYQLYAEKITLDGAGDLYKKFEELKHELEEMGMFAPEYKKSIPEYALNIGIVTSGTGAAIQDIINITKRRNPYVQLHLYPALVQGAMAAPDIVNGIRCLDSMDMDVIIVGRGGGSIEDLWAFNEEIVARAVFECETPVISAVGHETDTTIVDFVADRRAPTPSAAAELAVFDYERFVQDLNDKQYILARSLKRQVLNSRNMVEQYRLRLINKSPQNKLMQNRQYINDIQSRMSDIVHERINSKRNRLSVISERLNGLSPLNKLSKGFAYVQDNKGMPLVDIEQIKTGDRIKLHLKNGSALADIKNINKL